MLKKNSTFANLFLKRESQKPQFVIAHLDPQSPENKCILKQVQNDVKK